MIKIKILTTNKTKEKWLDEAILEYIKRLKQNYELTFIYAKDNEHLADLSQKEPYIITLDLNGKALTSPEFSTFLMHHIEKSGSRLAFIIGGAEGLPKNLKTANASISLSKMTFTHQMVRLLLVEQIFRADEIAKGSPYHK